MSKVTYHWDAPCHDGEDKGGDEHDHENNPVVMLAAVA